MCNPGRCPALLGPPVSAWDAPRPVAFAASPVGTSNPVQASPVPGVRAAAPEEAVPPERVLGGIETAVGAFVEALPYVGPDPRALLAQIAVRLARRVDETGALPAAVRELRVLLVQLTEVPNGPSGRVDEVRLRAAQRRLDSILAQAA